MNDFLAKDDDDKGETCHQTCTFIGHRVCNPILVLNCGSAESLCKLRRPDVAMSLFAPGDKRSLAYRVFHCVAHFRTFRIFANFANLKDFESRTVWEGALGSRRLFGMNCRAH